MLYWGHEWINDLISLKRVNGWTKESVRIKKWVSEWTD